jgi:rubrerythrin
MGEQEVDPYDREPPYTYECMDCGNRVEADHQPEECPGCGGQMQDLAVSRE